MMDQLIQFELLASFRKSRDNAERRMSAESRENFIEGHSEGYWTGVEDLLKILQRLSQEGPPQHTH